MGLEAERHPEERALSTNLEASGRVLQPRRRKTQVVDLGPLQAVDTVLGGWPGAGPQCNPHKLATRDPTVPYRGTTWKTTWVVSSSFLKKYLFIYLFGSAISSLWHVRSSLPCEGSLVAARRLF